MADTRIDYFSFLPNVYYQGITANNTAQGDGTLSKNLFRKAKIRPEIFGNVVVFQQYVIKGNQRPDAIAYELYGDSELDWIILLCNNIVNYYDEWPLSQEELYSYCISKYQTEEKLNAVRFYRTKEIRDDLGRLICQENLEVSSDFVVGYSDSSGDYVSVAGNLLLTPVTNYQYESELNDQKQNIFVLRKEFVRLVINDLRQIMTYNDHSDFIDYVNKLATNVVKI